jgi:hypothetical protein
VTDVIYDWPSSVVAAKQLFFAGGEAVDGGLTSGGARALSPEPGGRSWLQVEFAYQDNALSDPLVSWLMSKIGNGALFRIPVVRSPQLVPLSALGIAIAEYDAMRRFGLSQEVVPSELDGLPWQNGQPWENAMCWAFEPGAVISSAAAEGTTALILDMGDQPNGLQCGHVFGVGGILHKVDMIDYAGSVATVTVIPPLRRDVQAGDFVSFRPSGVFSAVDADGFRALYEPAGLIQPGGVKFMEAIL